MLLSLRDLTCSCVRLQGERCLGYTIYLSEKGKSLVRNRPPLKGQIHQSISLTLISQLSFSAVLLICFFCQLFVTLPAGT